VPELGNEPGGPAVAEPPTKTVPRQEQPPRLAPRYKVLIHNDDSTPMDFVILVLQDIFKKEMNDAFEIMLTAHHTGLALVCVLPLEEAELRIEQAHSMARPRKYPLTFTCEPA
jgi:ATP-dependent Clp protease adaptor protein ClpS